MPEGQFQFLSVRQLMWRKFVRHRMAVASGVVLICLYLVTAFAGFFAPYHAGSAESTYTWPPKYVYASIVIVLGFINWTGLAREVRGQVLSLRNREFVYAAEAIGASTQRVVVKHLISNVASHIIATATFAIPVTILGESALSFLGLGVKPPNSARDRLTFPPDPPPQAFQSEGTYKDDAGVLWTKVSFAFSDDVQFRMLERVDTSVEPHRLYVVAKTNVDGLYLAEYPEPPFDPPETDLGIWERR